MKPSYAEKRKLEELRQMSQKLDVIMAHFGLSLPTPTEEPASPSTQVESEIIQESEQLSVAGAGGDEPEPVAETTGRRKPRG